MSSIGRVSHLLVLAPLLFALQLGTVSAQAMISPGQAEVVQAQQNHQEVNFLEVKNAHVTQVLPDDLIGSKHQKWIVQLEDGSSLLCVYNSDMGDRIPVQVGQTMSLGGQYIWDRGGGLIHWLHADPQHRRPDGYVLLNGTTYGKAF
jgi:hypothetical protein